MPANPSRARAAWPYLFALCISALLTFPTALVLGLAGLGDPARLLLTLLGFVALSAGLITYVRCCLARPPARLGGKGPG